MKKTFISTLTLVILVLMSCDETVSPEYVLTLPKLQRSERLNETTGTTTTSYYTYDNDLLTKIQSGESEYRYSYTNSIITTLEVWSGERLITRYTYTIDSDTQVTVAQYAFDNGTERLLSVEERKDLGNSVLRYNFYSFPGGEKTLEYYIQKTVLGGNVTMEQSFDANGVSGDRVSTWKFGEAINPLSYVSGSVNYRNQNVATNHNFIDNGVLTIQQTHVIEVNEFNLPVEIRSVLRNNFFGDQQVTERYFYQ